MATAVDLVGRRGRQVDFAGDRANKPLAHAFRTAIEIIRQLPKDGVVQFTQEEKFKFYGLYQQATVGNNNTEKPPFYDVVAVAKWTSWKNFRDMARTEAMQQHVNLLIQVLERSRTFGDPKVPQLIQQLRTALSGNADLTKVQTGPVALAGRPGGDATPGPASPSPLTPGFPLSASDFSPVVSKKLGLHDAGGGLPETASGQLQAAAPNGPVLPAKAAEPASAPNSAQSGGPVLPQSAAEPPPSEAALRHIEQQLDLATDKLARLEQQHQRVVAVWRLRFWAVFFPLLLLLLRYVVAPRFRRGSK